MNSDGSFDTASENTGGEGESFCGENLPMHRLLATRNFRKWHVEERLDRAGARGAAAEEYFQVSFPRVPIASSRWLRSAATQPPPSRLHAKHARARLHIARRRCTGLRRMQLLKIGRAHV